MYSVGGNYNYSLTRSNERLNTFKAVGVEQLIPGHIGVILLPSLSKPPAYGKNFVGGDEHNLPE